MGWLDILSKIGGVVGAPFTGGASLAIPAAISGLGAVAGGLSNRAQTSTQSGTSSGTTAYNLDPNASTLNNQITQNYLGLLGNQPDFGAYSAGGLTDVNNVYDLHKQALEGLLAQRGINGPANANAFGNLENQRFSDVLRFKQNAPMNFQALQFPLLQNAGAFSGSLPRNVSTTGTTSGTGTTPGNVAGGTLGNLTSLLAYFYGQGGAGANINPQAPGQLPIPTNSYPIPIPGNYPIPV